MSKLTREELDDIRSLFADHPDVLRLIDRVEELERAVDSGRKAAGENMLCAVCRGKYTEPLDAALADAKE